MNHLKTVLNASWLIAVVGLGIYGIDAFKSVRSYISTNGTSTHLIESDEAVLVLEIENASTDLISAKDKRSEDRGIILEFLKQNGIDDSEIVETFSSVDDPGRWREQAPGENRKIFITDTIKVKSQKVYKIKEIAEKIYELLDRGIKVSARTSYYYKKLDDLRVKMLEEATVDALGRAKNVAKTSGLDIAGLRNLQTGRFVLAPEDSSISKEDNWGEESSLKKKISIVVTGTFNIK